MKFLWLMVVTAALALSGHASPVGAAITGNTFGPSASLGAGGRVATVTVLLNCTSPGAVRVAVTLTQNGTTATGHGGTRCTGATQQFLVRVTAHGASLDPGAAQVCGDAVNYSPGGEIDTRHWCRANGISLG